ncbi:hypothetical protein [Beijerinckia sp. L45]|uniref:hypothetical protein n=1 Tax=Beijerinckia sp. L45 TaxID=1641855 RepID=UPI00131B3E53|nr:hypothetical protein [Beijerinckia sp. L45]
MFKNMMVQLDGTVEDETRILHAEASSSRFGNARLTGLYINPLPEYPCVMGARRVTGTSAR